jgi:hypothetical protein
MPRKYEATYDYPQELSYGWQAWARDNGIDVGETWPGQNETNSDEDDLNG